MSLQLTSYPANLSPALYGNLLYGYSGTLTSPAAVSVINARDLSVVGSKTFLPEAAPYNINAAPFASSLISPQPVKTNVSGFVSNASLTSTLKLLYGGDYSQERTFTAAHRRLDPKEILSTKALKNRSISTEERDEISFALEPYQQISCVLTVSGRGKSITLDYAGTETNYGIRSFILCMPEITATANDRGVVEPENMKLDFRIDGNPAAEVGYEIVRPIRKTVRLAWLNSLGALEYHTFGDVLQISRYRDRGLPAATNILRTTPRCIENTTLSAGLCPEQECDALSEIIASPKVWRVTAGNCRSVEVMTKEANVASEKSEPFIIAIRETVPGEEAELW